MATDRDAVTGVLGLRNFSFRTDDLDHAVEFLSTNFGGHSRVPRRRGPLGYRVLAATSGRIVSGMSSCSIPTAVRTVGRFVALHLPLQHGADYRFGRRTIQSAPDAAVIIAPGHDYTVESWPGDTLAVLLDPTLLEQAIDVRRAKRPGNWALRSMRLALAPPDVQALRDLLQRHGLAIAEAQRSRRADELWALEDRMADWVAQRVIDADGLVSLSPTNRQIVQRVDAWIRQRISQPIALEQLCSAVGVSARTLQEACLAQRGQTPLEIVAARRLDSVRSMLEAGAVPTVTEAAVRSGFSHLGRFSLTYRRAFGEAPSETLARASALPASRERGAEPPREGHPGAR